MAEYGVQTLALVDGASFSVGSVIRAEYVLSDQRAGRSSMVSANVIVKVNANYTCSLCGSTENVQAHHQVSGDDSSLVVLCGECHSIQHPDIPKGLITCIKSHQPYWTNKSAATLAKELGIHSRTVIRGAKKLRLRHGYISEADLKRLRKKCSPYRDLLPNPEVGQCPCCGSFQTLRVNISLEHRIQKLRCNECGRLFVNGIVNPLLEKG